MKTHNADNTYAAAAEIYADLLFSPRSVFWSRRDKAVISTLADSTEDNRLRNDDKYIHICEYSKKALVYWIKEDLDFVLSKLLNTARINSCLSNKSQEIRHAINLEWSQ